MSAEQRGLTIVIGGHVDHGKSTIIGRLMADTGSLPNGKIEQVRANCARNSKPFEYAFLLDALRDEQAQGITIDSARVFFKTALRPYIIIDAPGHVEFLRNLVTGAARAEAALLVVDAQEGIQENSRRHGYMMRMLGIRQLVVVLNKMDLVGYDQQAYQRLVDSYTDFLGHIDVRAAGFIPVSGRGGDNIARSSSAMPWYTGPTVLEALDRFVPESASTALPFRMPVQDVYKFTQDGDTRRIVAGTVEVGQLPAGAELVFYPSGKKARLRSFEAFNREPPQTAFAGQSVGFTLAEHIFVSRGELATVAGEARPHVTTRIKASVFWLGRQPLRKDQEYFLKLGTARVPMRVEAVHRVMDAATLVSVDTKPHVDRHEVAECTLKLARAIAFDLADQIAATSRFVIVDDYEIRGGGIVREALPDTQSRVRDMVLLRNFKWEPSNIASERRAERYRQRATLVLITSQSSASRKTLAKEVEQRLFDLGNIVYFVGMGNVLYGIDADLERGHEQREEHLRRLAEVANLMLDAGVILIATAGDLTQEDVELIRTTVEPERIQTIWAGETQSTDLVVDLVVRDLESPDSADHVKRLLQDRGIIYRPW